MAKRLVISNKLPPEDCAQSRVCYSNDLKHLEQDPIALQYKPTYITHNCDAVHLSVFDGTNLVQWYGRLASGYYYPFGPVFEIVDE